MQAAVAFPGSIPIVETERLRLRGHRQDDFAACCALWSDPVVTKYTSGKALAPEEVWAKILRYAGLWSLLGYGYWAAEEKASGEFVGELGFGDFQRDIKPSLDGMPECGWAFLPRVHGKGYATEAVSAVVIWGDAHLGQRKTCCIVSPENSASVRVAEKCGYQEWQPGTYKEHDVLIFTR